MSKPLQKKFADSHSKAMDRAYWILIDIQNKIFVHMEGLENHAKEFWFDFLVAKELYKVLRFEWHGNGFKFYIQNVFVF